MKRIALLIPIVAALSMIATPRAHADAEPFPCPYPLVGVGVEIRLGLSAGGKFCDGPTEINGTHYHCEAGGATVSGGGIGLAPFNGLTFGGILGGGVGGGGSGCSWRCPDNTLGPQPNPPGAWKDYLVVLAANNSCIGHMRPAGPTSQPVEPDQGPPGFQDPTVLPPAVTGPLAAEPAEPAEPPQTPGPLGTVLNPGQGNPESLR